MIELPRNKMSQQILQSEEMLWQLKSHTFPYLPLSIGVIYTYAYAFLN